MDQKQRKEIDYWNISYRNFLVLGVFCAFVSFFLFFSTFIGALILLLIGIFYVFVSSMLKKHNRYGIFIGYGIVFLGLLGNLVNNVAHLSFTLTDVLGYVVLLYIFVNLYKAQKQTPISPPTQPNLPKDPASPGSFTPTS